MYTCPICMELPVVPCTMNNMVALWLNSHTLCSQQSTLILMHSILNLITEALLETRMLSGAELQSRLSCQNDLETTILHST